MSDVAAMSQQLDIISVLLIQCQITTEVISTLFKADIPSFGDCGKEIFPLTGVDLEHSNQALRQAAIYFREQQGGGEDTEKHKNNKSNNNNDRNMISNNNECFYPHSEIGMALQHSQFGSGSGLFHYERLGCHGDENTLSACRSRTFVTGDCNHGNEAALVCEPPEGQCDFKSVMATRPE